MTFAVADIRRQELTMMDEPMNKLERGTYGLCEDCGVEIDGFFYHIVTPGG